MSDYTHWFVGMKVVCVGRIICANGIEAYPVNGQVYTIRTITAYDEGVFIRLKEIVNPVLSYANGVEECDFHVEGFRPLQQRPTDISIFTAMLTGAKEREPA